MSLVSIELLLHYCTTLCFISKPTVLVGRRWWCSPLAVSPSFDDIYWVVLWSVSGLYATAVYLLEVHVI